MKNEQYSREGLLEKYLATGLTPEEIEQLKKQVEPEETSGNLKLKPCPICGGDTITTKQDLYGYEDEDWYILCEKCGLFFGFWGQYETEEEVIDAWNRRADHAEN